MVATNASQTASIVTDRSSWLRLARAHYALGNREGFSWALDNARRARVQPDLTAARLAWTERDLVKAASVKEAA